MSPLLAQFRRGERAFERVYRRYVADVYRYALAMLRDPNRAEEVGHRTFPDAYGTSAALSCHEVERAISRDVDGRLARAERSPLRRHLRECAACAGFASSQRARRSAWETLANAPLPASLASFFGRGSAALAAAALPPPAKLP